MPDASTEVMHEATVDSLTHMNEMLSLATVTRWYFSSAMPPIMPATTICLVSKRKMEPRPSLPEPIAITFSSSLVPAT